MTQLLVLGGLLVVLSLPLLVVARLPRPEARLVWRVLLVALAVRLVVVAALEVGEAWHVTARGATTPDEASVDLAARLLARGDPRSPVVLGGSLHTSWLLVSWAVYDLLWNSLLAIKMLNALLGAALVVPVYLLARTLHSAPAARVAGWGVALYPSAVVWSALALREPLIALLVTTLVLIAVTPVPQEWPARAGYVALAAAALVVLAFTRSYMAPLLAGVVVAAAALRSARHRRPQDALAAVAVATLSLAMLLSLPTGGDLARVTVALVVAPDGSAYNPFSDCDARSGCVPADSPAAALEGVDLPGAALADGALEHDADLAASLQSVEEKGVVRAVAVAVLAGRPVWRTAEFFLLLQPGVVLWWAVLPLVAAGGLLLAVRRRWDALAATAGYAVAVFAFLAMTGQFIRHHYMVEPVALALAATGLVAVLEARRRGERRPAAAVAGGTVVMAVAAVASVVASLV